MINSIHAKAGFSPTLLATLLSAAMVTSAHAGQAEEAALQQKIQKLEAELIKAKQELSKAKKQAATAKAQTAEPEKPNTDMVFDVAGGKLKVGGAVRVNYILGDYAKSPNGETSRAFSEGGNLQLDTYRINLDYTNGSVIGKLEYRWYEGYGAFGSGYNMLHTGWVGYNYANGGQVQVGVNRVPFGPGAYGISQSFFFDQHYYVGLSDDMDLGIKYSWKQGNWAWDTAFYAMDEGSYRGSSKKADRYSYDPVVDVNGNGYEEAGQLNLRGIYSTKLGGYDTDLGFSLQYGHLNGKGVNAAGQATDDGDMYAVSGHMINQINGFKLASQLTYYRYDVDQVGNVFGSATDPVQNGEIYFGAFSFPTAVADEAFIPAVSLSYYKPTPAIGWLDYVIPFVEYSTIVKQQSGFNDSDLFTIGAAFGTAGGWYSYVEYANSSGNDFIGDGSKGQPFGHRFGANANDGRLERFNINLGYYF